MTFLYITCMVLTGQVPEIEVYISEHSAFPSVNVWVWQWGEPGKNTHVIPMPGLHLFIWRPSLLFPFLYSLFILYSLIILYSMFLLCHDHKFINLHQCNTMQCMQVL